VFSLPSRDEFAALEVDRVLARGLTRPGLGWDSRTGRVFQAASVRSEEAPFTEVCAGIGELLDQMRPTPADRLPVRVRDVPWPLPWLDIPPPDAPSELPIPLAGAVLVESGELAWFDGEDDGPVIAVMGPPRSGRSTALLSLGRMAREMGYEVCALPLSRRSPLGQAPTVCVDRIVERGDLPSLTPAAQPCVVLIDDIHRWDGSADDLEGLLKESTNLIVVVSGPNDFFGMRNDVTRALKDLRSGLTLMPVTARDGDALGLRRVPDEALGDPKAGRGVFVLAGEAHIVQVPMPA
jgi:S-DNA-T family DNA segregation ATPase FtsK/SpoIIIE